MFERNPIFILGLLFLGVFAGLDMVIRVRMSGIGVKKVWLLGGAWNYSEYLRACSEHGWSKALLYVTMAFFLGGLACLALGIWLSS